MNADKVKPGSGDTFRAARQTQIQQPPQRSSQLKYNDPLQEFEIDHDGLEKQKLENLRKIDNIRRKLSEKNGVLLTDKVLSEVNVELSTVDATLSKNFEVYRKQIESLSVKLSTCKTECQRKQQEYEDAKLDFETVTERKNRMTEHLMQIVNENEKRKEEKLNGLIGKMHLTKKENGEAVEKKAKGISRNSNFLSTRAKKTSNWFKGKVNQWRFSKESKRKKKKAGSINIEPSSVNHPFNTDSQVKLSNTGADKVESGIAGSYNLGRTNSEALPFHQIPSKNSGRNCEGHRKENEAKRTKSNSDKTKCEVSSHNDKMFRNSIDKGGKQRIESKVEDITRNNPGKTKTETSSYYHFASTPPELAKKFQPKKITNTDIQSKQFTTAVGASKWNPGNTYEDRDYTKLVNEKWSAMMREFNWPGSSIKVDSFPKLAMEFSIVCARNKIKYIYDMSFTLKWKGNVKGEEVSGELHMSDIMPDWEPDEWEWNVTTGKNDIAHKSAKAIVDSSRDSLIANVNILIAHFRKKGS